ncbi:MAG: dihydroorotase [Bacteroidota bacterium]
MLLIKNAVIVDPGHSLNGRKRDILIEEGVITEIKSRLKVTNAEVMDVKGACVSLGWLDMGVHTGDPGFEHRENFQTVAKAAVAGGFTALACLPNTQPVLHSKSEVQYVRNSTRTSLVDFYPIGAVSRNCEGVDITEMYDMYHSGAVAFSDGSHAIQNNGLMMRALQYVKAFDGVILNQPHDLSIAANGQVHEGKVSTLMGIRGIPDMAEEMMVQRDLYLAEYTDSRVHIANVSTANSVALIQQAKRKGVKVTASVAVLNLAFDDAVLLDFDPAYKVLPPLRRKSDINALKKGLKNGTIDMIASNHTPLEEEAKNLEFAYASFGSIGLESCYALCNTILGDFLGTDAIVQLLSHRPRQLLRLPIPAIAKGASANLTIFDPKEAWTFEPSDIRSRSSNTPLVGHQLTGRVKGVVNNGLWQEVNK